MLRWLSATAAGSSSAVLGSPSVSLPGWRSPTLGASVAGLAPTTCHLSGFSWGPPTQDTGRCCSKYIYWRWQVVFAELMLQAAMTVIALSPSVCVDGWFILGIMIAHAPQVCSPTQPESNQSDSGQVRL